MKALFKTTGISLLVIAIAIMLSSLSMTTAQADTSGSTTSESPSCNDADTSTASGACSDIKTSSAHSKETSRSIAAVGTKGKILTRYFVASGVKLKGAEKSSGCKLVSSYSKVPHGATCFRLKRGGKFINSGVTSSGQVREWNDYVGSPGSSTPGAKWMKFVKRGGKWVKAGDQTGNGNCANPVRFNGPKPKLSWKNVINIKSFSNWTFKGSVSAQADAEAEAMSKSWCNQDGSQASATAVGSAMATAQSKASYKVRGLSKIQAWVKGQSIELQQTLKLSVDAQAKAKAKAQAVANSWTQAKCQGSPGEVTEYQPPAVDVSASACVAPGQTNGFINVIVRNPNAINDVVLVEVSRGSTLWKAQSRAISAGQSVTIGFAGPTPDTYTIKATLQNAHKSATTQVTVAQCANPTCEDVYGPGYTGEYPNCTKDGTTTPVPDPGTPGENPDPADPGTPGSQCYSETTGQPVPTNPDGTCPPGSFG